MRVLVTGASGLVGSALCAALGQDAVPLHRGASWDPARGVLDPRVLDGIDAIVHLGGESIASGRWTPEVKRRIRESRVRGTELLAAAAGGLRVLVSASAVGWYGDRGDEVLDEDSAPGRGFLADVCRAWEDAASAASGTGTARTREDAASAASGTGAARTPQDAASAASGTGTARTPEDVASAASGPRVCRARFGMILSARGGALAKMLPLFRLGLGGPLGSGRQWVSWVTLDDVVAALLHLLRHGRSSGPYNVVSPEPVTNAAFTKALARVLRRPAFLPAPAAALRLALGEMAEELLLASTRAVPTRLTQEGFTFAHLRIEDALRAVLS